jgi:D-xylose 1-dehydrogenase (NADP+, D-xylono-1,5-lactone-forming)
MEAFMWRFHPATEQLTRLVSEGAIGNLRVVRCSFGFDIVGSDENVRWSGELEGGALMDVGCYCVSALRLLCGEPERVSGEAVAGGAGVDARFAALLRFPGDVLGVIDCGLDVHARSELEICGTQGRIVLADPWHAIDPTIVVERGFEREVIAIEPADSYALELDDMAAAIAGERAPRLGREDAMGQARTIEALYRSAAEGRAVALGA